MHAVEVSVKVDGELHEAMTILATKLMIQSLGMLDGDKPAGAMEIEIDLPGDELRTFGSILVRDPKVYIEILAILDEHFGKAVRETTGLPKLVNELLEILRNNDPPLDPRRN